MIVSSYCDIRSQRCQGAERLGVGASGVTSVQFQNQFSYREGHYQPTSLCALHSRGRDAKTQVPPPAKGPVGELGQRQQGLLDRESVPNVITKSLK